MVENLEAQFRMKNGYIRTALMSARIISIEGVDCILSITRDISERKQAELALQLSEDKFAKVFRSSPNAILISRMEDFIIIDANAIFFKLLNVTRQAYRPRC